LLLEGSVPFCFDTVQNAGTNFLSATSRSAHAPIDGSSDENRTFRPISVKKIRVLFNLGTYNVSEVGGELFPFRLKIQKKIKRGLPRLERKTVSPCVECQSGPGV
jgi:hypothetical protein